MKKSFSNKTLKTLFISTVAVTSSVAPLLANAQDYDALIGDSQATIDLLSAEQTSVQTELENAYAQIETLQEEAELLVSDLEADKEAIKALQAEIDELAEMINERETLLAEQVRKVQVQSGSTNYLNYIASANSVSDMVGRADVVNKMVSVNQDTIDLQKEDKEALETKQEEAQDARNERVEKIGELESITAEIKEQASEQELVAQQLNTDIESAVGQQAALLAEKAAYEEEQRILAEQAALAEQQAQAEAAAQAEIQANAAIQAEYEAALAEAEAQDAAIAQAQAEADAAAAAEAEAQAYAEQAAVAAQEAAANAEAIANAPVEYTEVPATDEYTEPTYEVVEVDRSAEIAAAQEAAAAAEAEAAAAAEAAAQASATNAASQANVETLLANAAAHIGTPYVWGGRTPGGFDCSGFVQYVYKQTYGIDVGSWTGEQQYAGDVISVSEAQPGDLYFWGTPGGSTSHVAIATGGGEYIHAVQPGSPLGYNNIQWYTPQFAVRVAK